MTESPAIIRGQREEIPSRRIHISWREKMETIEYALSYGMEEHVVEHPGEPPQITEVWCNAGKVGSALEALANDAAIMASIVLQLGYPIEKLRMALTRNSNRTAAGPIGVLLDRIAAGER
jgi:hypothetical protein